MCKNLTLFSGQLCLLPRISVASLVVNWAKNPSLNLKIFLARVVFSSTERQDIFVCFAFSIQSIFTVYLCLSRIDWFREVKNMREFYYEQSIRRTRCISQARAVYDFKKKKLFCVFSWGILPSSGILMTVFKRWLVLIRECNKFYDHHYTSLGLFLLRYGQCCWLFGKNTALINVSTSNNFRIVRWFIWGPWVRLVLLIRIDRPIFLEGFFFWDRALNWPLRTNLFYFFKGFLRRFFRFKVTF